MANKITILLMAIVLVLTGCKKQEWLEWKAMNEAWLQKNKTVGYYEENGIQFPIRTTHSGLQYAILADPNPTEARPSMGSTVTVTYSLDLINTYGTDAAGNRLYSPIEKSTSSFAMAGVVSGFSEGLRLIHTHGDIILFVPHSEGYGKTGAGVEGGTSFIPPFSTLIFRIHLDEVR